MLIRGSAHSGFPTFVIGIIRISIVNGLIAEMRLNLFVTLHNGQNITENEV